jgi:Domain of unknown function (DUF927)
MLGLIGRQVQVRLENGNARVSAISALVDRGCSPFGSSLLALCSIGQRNYDRRCQTRTRLGLGATSNGLEGVAVVHNDALLCLDEISQVSAKEAGDIERQGSPGRFSSRRKIIGFRCPLPRKQPVQNPPQDRKVFQLGKGDHGVMQTGRDRGLNKPEALSEHQARQREWDQSADIIRASGHRSRAERPDI